MPTPLYAGHDQPSKPSKGLDAHKGLWFEHFFNEYDDSWNVNGENAKKNWIKTVEGFCGDKDQLETNAILQRQLCTDLNGKSKAFKNNWHFITGMGNPHPVENGMSWHPTLGVPYLTGASVKGLVRAFVEEWSDLSSNLKKEMIYRWFGSDHKAPDKQEKENQAGCFIFFDALPIKPVTLHTDIMTPHMGNWYSDGGEISSDTPRDTKNSYAEALPADWHKPVIIPFLVVKHASLQFSIAPRPHANISPEDIQKELPEVMKMLDNALEYLGGGAKTAAGYGRFDSDEMAENKLKKEVKAKAISKIKDPIEAFKALINDMEEKKIAEMFGKRFSRTKKEFSDKECDFNEIIKVLIEGKRNMINNWKPKDKQEKNTAQGKAYIKLSKYFGDS